jgi:hypothetical protein
MQSITDRCRSQAGTRDTLKLLRQDAPQQAEAAIKAGIRGTEPSVKSKLIDGVGFYML